MTPRRPPATGARALQDRDRPGVPGARLLARALDAALHAAIDAAAVRAAGQGGLRFTERQLYFETCRVLDPSLTVLSRVPRTARPYLRLPSFTRALDARGRDTVPGLLPPPPPPPKESRAPERASEPDLYSYGLPRLLVCQDRGIARMLLANHVHLEAACPVLAVAGALPFDPGLTGALERAGGATVYVLHDASPRGIALRGQVRAALGPVPGVRVSSLGLVPRHAQAMRLPAGRGPVHGAELAGLPGTLRPQETAWLARGRFAEVAAVSPERLVRGVLRLTRGPRIPRAGVWAGLRDLRTKGFLTWPDSTGRP
ncbi:hypothetical protein [Streptomyces sp. NBC_00102]|uniref:hypothetical protein n=1 Tax=Streptomyces sp. NBC_00102 TaxID=2975652 RepID=UPI00225BFA31|nr:hypothetical protein [Streptomyces sp. NBC_00102]MCX5401861.1 hypothetical protein [Streptomyces sp. NBC_00102]